jgi:hypothetical protein
MISAGFKKRIVLMAAVLSCMTVEGYAEESKKLDFTFDLTYWSKYMNKGTSPYGSHGALIETFDIDLWGTGFGVAVGHQSATGSGYCDKQRLNYKIYYDSSIFKDEVYMTKFRVDWIYKNYYGRARDISNTQNLIFDFSWPNILPIKNLSPYYIADYECPAGSDYDNRDISGMVHIFGLAYDWKIPSLPNPLKLTAETAYNDGYGHNVDHDWSYSTLGMSTKFNITDKMSMVVGIYEQITMEESININKDITYCKISIKYKF